MLTLGPGRGQAQPSERQGWRAFKLSSPFYSSSCLGIQIQAFTAAFSPLHSSLEGSRGCQTLAQGVCCSLDPRSVSHTQVTGEVSSSQACDCVSSSLGRWRSFCAATHSSCPSSATQLSSSRPHHVHRPQSLALCPPSFLPPLVLSFIICFWSVEVSFLIVCLYPRYSFLRNSKSSDFLQGLGPLEPIP